MGKFTTFFMGLFVQLKFDPVKLFASLPGLFIGYGIGLMGGYDMLLSLMFCVMFGDILSGIGIGIFKTELKFSKFFFGMFKKSLLCYLIIIGTKIDLALGTTVIRTGFIGFVIGYELLSLINNYDMLGLPAPESLKNFAVKLRSQADNFTIGGNDE